jgi:predicted Zn-dependent protease
MKRSAWSARFAFHAAVAALAAILTLAAAPALAQAPAPDLPKKEDWIELRTANFTLFSDAGEKTVRRIGTDLELLRSALGQLTPGLTLTSPTPTYIYVFKDVLAFKPYRQTSQGKPIDSGGYFLSRQLGNYVAFYGGPRVLERYGTSHGDERAIIYHEYLHNVLRNNYASLPLWLNEGLAEYYSTFDVGKNEVQIGRPVAEHVAWLRRNPLIPVASLFTVDESSQSYDELHRSAFYASSWALVHYLISGTPERRLQATEALRLAQAGTPPDQIFRQAFGTDPAALDRELTKYVQSYIFNFSRVPLRTEADLAMTVRPLAWADALYRLGDLLANLGPEQAAAAAAHFRAALAERPDHGPALAGLGYLEDLAERPEEARPWYEKAAKLAPDDFLVQYLYARDLLENPGPDSLRQARASLSKAVQLRPDFGEAWARLGYTYMVGEELAPDSIQALETAHRLLPSRMDIAHNLAIAYARTAQPEKAEALIEGVLVARGAEPDLIENAREAVLDEDYTQAEHLVEQGKLEEAVLLLERIRARSSQQDRRDQMAERIREVQKAQSFSHFVNRYNEAVSLANKGDVKGAVAILEPLIEMTPDPVQAERARTLIERLKRPEKKSAGSRRR